MYVDSGSAVLGNQTLLHGNWAPKGQQASIQSGEMLYYLPASAGRWLPSVRTCTVQREPCRQRAGCEPTQQPELPAEDQPCNFTKHPELRERAVSAMSIGAVDGSFPDFCGSGYDVSSTGVAAQSWPTCSGPCPAGFYCPGNGSHPIVCPPHTYCDTGRTLPADCPPGTVGSRAGLTSRSECTDAAPGFWATAGQAIPCMAGWYQPLWGARSQAACVMCPVNSTTAQNKQRCSIL